MGRKWCAAAAVAAIIGLAACDGQDQAEAGAPGGMDAFQQQMDPEMMAAMMELQEIQAQLEPVQQQSLQDPELAARLEAVSARIDAAMRARDADLIQRVERFQADLTAAQEAGDEDAMQARMNEAYGLQMEVEALQASVLEQPDIRADIKAFEAEHRARMIALDPAVEALIDRLEAILARFDG